MMNARSILKTILLAAAATGAGWYAAQEDLLGEGSPWIECRADYAPAKRPILDAPPDENPSGKPAPAETDANEPREEPAPGAGETGPKPLETDAEEEAEGSPAFPLDGKPAGLDRRIREAIVPYTVRPGDTLSGIGKRFRVPFPLIANLNGLEDDGIRAGEVLDVVEGPFHVLVLLDEKRLRLYHQGVFVKAYTVAVGRKGHETKTGTFRVRTKRVEPDWTDPDTGSIVPYGTRENPLGTRWIGFGDGFGIHGTWEPESLGKAASRGCVRMANEDVEELFGLLVRRASVIRVLPGGTRKKSPKKEEKSLEEESSGTDE